MTALAVEPRKAGRPIVEPTSEQIAIVLDMAVEGATLHAMGKALRINPDTINKWAARYPERFGEDYVRAREVGALTRLDVLHAIIATKPSDPVEATWQRTCASIAQWELSKALPKVFGDKLNVEHSGNLSVTVATGIPDLTSIPLASPKGIIGYALGSEQDDSAPESSRTIELGACSGLDD